MAKPWQTHRVDGQAVNALPIILASASPRRRELLDRAGICFESMPVNIDETPRLREAAHDLVTRLAIEKVKAAREKSNLERVIIGADTVVVIDDKILGKPNNRQHAEQLLELLAGREHQVLSGVALSFCAHPGAPHVQTRLSRSRVWFRDITRAERIAYCRTDEPMDKSGAYAIQGMAAMFVVHLEGSYTGVMGLPLFETLDLLALAGVSPLVGS